MWLCPFSVSTHCFIQCKNEKIFLFSSFIYTCLYSVEYCRDTRHIVTQINMCFSLKGWMSVGIESYSPQSGGVCQPLESAVTNIYCGSGKHHRAALSKTSILYGGGIAKCNTPMIIIYLQCCFDKKNTYFERKYEVKPWSLCAEGCYKHISLPLLKHFWWMLIHTSYSAPRGSFYSWEDLLEFLVLV